MGILAIITAIESILGNSLVVDAINYLLTELHLKVGQDKLDQALQAAKELLAGGNDLALAIQSIQIDYQLDPHHAATIAAAAQAHNTATAPPQS